MIFLISLSLVLFSFAIFSFTALFSHNFWFSIFAGVTVGWKFLKRCEISRFANFRRLRNSACAALFIFFFLPFHFPATFRFLLSINFSRFVEPQPLTTILMDNNGA